MVEGAKVVYESAQRLGKLINEIKEIYGNMVEIRICREMTKKFEEIRNGIVGDGRGEVTVVFK